MTAFVVLVVAFCGWRLVLMLRGRQAALRAVMERDARALAAIKANSSPEVRERKTPSIPARLLPDGSMRTVPQNGAELNEFVAQAVKDADLRAQQEAREKKTNEAQRARYFKEFEEAKLEVDRKTGEQVDAVVARYVEVLSRKYNQLTFKDDYGDWNFDAWHKEVDAFIERKLAHIPKWRLGDHYDRIMVSVHRFQDANHDDETGVDRPGAPVDYERAVAGKLTAAGWDARLTVASEDQCADVIAVKDGRRLVVQCKLYSQSVGNKAVQEVYAAKRHEGADFAAVVSNAGYTKSARRLASTTGVLLLHDDELAGLNRRLGMEDVGEV